MKKLNGFASVLVSGLLILAASVASAAEPVTAMDEGATGKDGALTGTVSSISIFPVVLMGRPMTNVAEVAGIMMEKEGMRNIKIMDKPFQPEEGQAFPQTAEAFGAHVKKNPIKTDYALFAVYLGSSEGIKSVNGAMVDKQGEVVWENTQAPGDKIFKEVNPGCPMTCCVLLTEMVKPMLKLSGKQDGPGELEKQWAAKTGMPLEQEEKAMEQSLALLKKAGKEAQVVVFPVRVKGEVDREGAVQLASFLNEKKICKARVAEKDPNFDIKGNSNQMRMLWDMARAFRDYVKKNKGETYTLYADYMLSPRDGRVHGVHFTICDPKGDWVIVDLQNNHQDDFNAVDPKSVKGWNELVVRRFASYL